MREHARAAFLRPGGHIAITIRPWREHAELIDLPSQILACGIHAGLIPVERCVALLARAAEHDLVARGSFFQRDFIRKQREAGLPLHLIAHEDVLAGEGDQLTHQAEGRFVLLCFDVLGQLAAVETPVVGRPKDALEEPHRVWPRGVVIGHANRPPVGLRVEQPTAARDPLRRDGDERDLVGDVDAGDTATGIRGTEPRYPRRCRLSPDKSSDTVMLLPFA